MSPSAVETAQQAVEEIKTKTLPIHDKPQDAPAHAESLEVKPIHASNGNGTNGSTPAAQHDVLPQRLEDHKEPLKLSGVLDQFTSFDVTPVIGREYVGVDLAKWLRAPNSDELLRDLAITSMSFSISYSVPYLPVRTSVSQRGVVFFRAQDNITDELQKELVQRLGELSGKPATSKLHIHPISNASREHGGKDNEISVISSEQQKKLYTDR